MALFKNNYIGESPTVNIGSFKSADKGIEVVWYFDELKRSDIATYYKNNKIEYAIEKNCSCQGEIQVTDTFIKLIYNDKGSVGSISKRIILYLKDEKHPTVIKNDRGIDIFNPKLGFIELKFTGIAVS